MAAAVEAREVKNEAVAREKAEAAIDPPATLSPTATKAGVAEPYVATPIAKAATIAAIIAIADRMLEVLFDPSGS